MTKVVDPHHINVDPVPDHIDADPDPDPNPAIGERFL